MISLLLIPAALCFTFGRNIKDKKQELRYSWRCFMLALALAVVGYTEQG